MTFTEFLLSGMGCFAVGLVCGWVASRVGRGRHTDESALQRSREHLAFVRQKKREMDGRRA